MSSALNGSSAIRHFEGSDAIEIRDGITFDFYTELPHMFLQPPLELWRWLEGSSSLIDYVLTWKRSWNIAMYNRGLLKEISSVADLVMAAGICVSLLSPEWVSPSAPGVGACGTDLSLPRSWARGTTGTTQCMNHISLQKGSSKCFAVTHRGVCHCTIAHYMRKWSHENYCFTENFDALVQKYWNCCFAFREDSYDIML